MFDSSRLHHILTILLYLLIWPFHSKPAAPKPPPPVIPHVAHLIDPEECDLSEDGYFFLGQDNLVGISTASCDLAFVDWLSDRPKKIPLDNI